MWCYNSKPSNTFRSLQFDNHISLVKQDTNVSQKVCRCAINMLSYKFHSIIKILQPKILMHGCQILIFLFLWRKRINRNCIWYMRLEILIQIMVFWDMILCSLVDKYQTFQIKYTASIFRCWSHFTSTYLPNYMTLHPTRQSEKLNNFHTPITMQNCITLPWIC
jgi:hypothetical protein